MNDISGLPKILLHDHLSGDPAQTPDTLTAQVRSHLQSLVDDRVVYVELRISPQAHTAGGLTIQEVIDCAVAGLDVPLIDARLIPTAHPGHPVSDVHSIAELVVRNHGPQVVGFDIAGEFSGAGLREHAASFALLRENFVPFTVHAGLHGGIAEIIDAVQLGAVRLGHAVALIDDFHIDTEGFEGVLPGRVSGWVRDRHIPIEVAPSLEVAVGAVDELSEHPLTLLQQLGFTCTVNTGQQAAAGTLTEEFQRLEEVFGYGLEEFFDLTVNAVKAAFISEVERQELLERVILPAYEAQDLEAGLDEFGAERP